MKGASTRVSRAQQALSRFAPVAAWIAVAGSLLGQVPTAWTTGRVLSGGMTCALAHDLVRQRVVLVGGLQGTASGAHAVGTWELDGNGWIQRPSATSPPGRYGHAIAYDMSRRRVVLFGGFAASGSLADTWEWDGASWIARSPAASPPARRGHALAYDMARKRIVLFGGFADFVRFGDTWEWDGQSWVQRTPAASPPARQNHALAYDIGRQRVVLFGGGQYGTWLADTWEWDGTSWWQQGPVASPPGTFGHAMAYDLVSQRTLLVGGEGQFGYQMDTWEWNGMTWTQRTPVTRPSARTNAGLAYDMSRNRVVLSGGAEGFMVPLSDTWEWDRTNWMRRPDTSPSARAEHTLAYDAARREVVLFGGYGSALYDDTWVWDGARWTRREPVVRPPARFAHSMAWDAMRQRLVVFGGRWLGSPGAVYADTWEWDGTTWTLAQPAVSPTARSWHGMAYDAARRRVVLFGGGDTVATAETWEWDGSNWTQRVTPTTPPARMGGVLVYDSARQRVVLFDGNLRADTWEWDGARWTQRSTSVAPTPRLALAAAFDEARQRVVVFGGYQGTVFSHLSDTWEWDGASWSERTALARPIARVGHALAYDGARQRIVLFGGSDAASVHLSDTMLYGSAAGATAASFGAACPGASGLPMLTSNEPHLGNPRFVLDLLSVRGSAPCVIGLAGSDQSLAIGGGCTLYLREPILPLLAIASSAGFASLSLAVPNDPGLLAMRLYAQGFVVDAQGPVVGLALSDGRRLVLGH